MAQKSAAQIKKGNEKGPEMVFEELSHLLNPMDQAQNSQVISFKATLEICFLELMGPAIGEFPQNEGHLVCFLNDNDVQTWSLESGNLVCSL